MCKLIVLFVSLITIQPTYCQSYTDSAAQQKLQIDSLIERSTTLLKSNNDSTEILAKKALTLSEIISDSFRISEVIHILGNVYFVRGNYDKAISNWRKSLEIRRILGNEEKIAGSLNNISLAYEKQGSYIESISYLEQALDIYLTRSDSVGLARVYGNLGILYETMRDYEVALFFHEKSLPFIKNDEEALSRHYINVGLVYSAMDNYDSALYLYNQSLKLKEKYGDKWGISAALSSIGEVYSWQGKVDSAILVYLKAKALMKPLKANHLIAMANINLAKLFYKKGSSEKSLQLLKESEEFLREQEVSDQLDAFLLLARIYGELGALEKSNAYYQTFAVKTEEYRKADIEGELANQKSQLYFKEKQKNDSLKLQLSEQQYLSQIAEEQKVKNMLFFLISVIIVIFGLSTLFYQRIIRKNKELITQRMEIKRLNLVQERLIEMKTQQIMNTQEIIDSYAYRNAHDLRGPLARILGILNLFEIDNTDKDELWKRMKESATELEKVVYKIARELEKSGE